MDSVARRAGRHTEFGAGTCPAHAPPPQTSPTVHGSPSSHAVPVVKPSAGQRPLKPLQVSAASHGPVAARQVVPGWTNVQLVVQQTALVPFAAPRSHCSVDPTIPFPHVSAVS